MTEFGENDMKPSEKHAEICDVAPRDGFQGIPEWIPTDTKTAVVEGLAASGIRRIETGAFVSPKHVPQMADTIKVHARAEVGKGVRLPTLVPNLRGAENALAAGIVDIVFVFSVSESHNKSNVCRPVAASITELGEVIHRGRDLDGFSLRVNLATVFDCPFKGLIEPDAVYAAVDAVLAFGYPVEFGFCDTTGRAFPDGVGEISAGAIARFAGDGIGWAFHGHDTYGLGVANALAAYDGGIRAFDSAAAGIGGCPFAPGASGNTATEDLVFAFENMGIATGVDLAALLALADRVAELPGAQPGGHTRQLPRPRVLRAA